MLPKYYTIKEVAKSLNLSTKTIRRYIEGDKLDCEKLPGMTGRLRFTEQHIENFRKNHMTV
jgi:excisionase family DNA binding protein